jgi:hypothetical protein
MASEEERAREYRRQMQARANNRLVRERAMAGDAAARAALETAWAPLRRWDGWDPISRVRGDDDA